MAEEKEKSTFNDHRIVYVSGELDEEKTKSFTERMIELECRNTQKDILVWIDTYGGAVDSFLAMYDVIKLMRCDVATVCIGKAMSCGAMLLMSGTKGKRFITRNARVMTHQIWGGAQGSLSEIETATKEMRRLQEQLEQIFHDQTGQTVKAVRKLMSDDNYLTPNEAKTAGIVDGVVNKPSDMYSRIKV